VLCSYGQRHRYYIPRCFCCRKFWFVSLKERSWIKTMRVCTHDNIITWWLQSLPFSNYFTALFSRWCLFNVKIPFFLISLLTQSFSAFRRLCTATASSSDLCFASMCRNPPHCLPGWIHTSLSQYYGICRLACVFSKVCHRMPVRWHFVQGNSQHVNTILVFPCST